MLHLEEYSYRYAKAVLMSQEFESMYHQIVKILQDTEVPYLNPAGDPRHGGVKRRKRERTRINPHDRYFFLPIDQKTLNVSLDRAFKEVGWTLQPLVVPGGSLGPDAGLKADYKKGKVQVEVQFGNMARWYTDVFKFQLSYSLGEIDAGVLVVPKKRFANLIDENVAQYERVIRELPWAKMSLTLPILVIGIEPINYTNIREIYNEAASHFQQRMKEAGSEICVIPFENRIEEEIHDEVDPN